jgi:hypothetical protein
MSSLRYEHEESDGLFISGLIVEGIEWTQHFVDKCIQTFALDCIYTNCFVERINCDILEAHLFKNPFYAVLLKIPKKRKYDDFVIYYNK